MDGFMLLGDSRQVVVDQQGLQSFVFVFIFNLRIIKTLHTLIVLTLFNYNVLVYTHGVKQHLQQSAQQVVTVTVCRILDFFLSSGPI